MPKFYITTPIYYVNDLPHIGHAYSTIAADVLARYKRLCSYDVLFVTGTDEHGRKIEQAAAEQNKPVAEFVDEVAQAFIDMWQNLNISYDDFIRTTQPRHIKVVEQVFSELLSKNLIYKGVYRGWYCIQCENFLAPTELRDGKWCPEGSWHRLEQLEEVSYFFSLSQFEVELRQLLEANHNLVLPQARRNEVLSFIRGGLRDASVSRARRQTGWGVAVPCDAENVVYVWFDALLNYLTACGYLYEPEKFEYYWPADVHIIGKEILRFHAIIWPALLLGLGLPLYKSIFAHGWWTVGGEKMSKSLGNIVDPCLLANELSENYKIKYQIVIDSLRYYLLREATFGLDADFSKEGLIRRYNAELANDLGNLLNRTLPLIERYCNVFIPKPSLQEDLWIDLIKQSENIFQQVERALDNLEFSAALTSIWELVRACNKSLDIAAPWRLAADGQTHKLNTALYNIADTIWRICILILPFMPTVAKEISEQLGAEELLKDIRWDAAKEFGKLPYNLRINRREPIFPRIKS